MRRKEHQKAASHRLRKEIGMRIPSKAAQGLLAFAFAANLIGIAPAQAYGIEPRETAPGNTFVDEGLEYKVLTSDPEKTAELVGFENDPSEETTVTVPATASDSEDDYSVVSIGGDAFFEQANVTGIDFSNASNLISIEDNAFRDSGLTGTLTLPPNLTSIAWGAFMDTGLSGSLTVPQSVANIEPGAFAGTSLTELVLPETGSLAIGAHAFRDTKLSGSLAIPQSVTKIGTSAFSGTQIDALLFLGDSPPTGAKGSAFADTPDEGTVYHPAEAAANYDPGMFGAPVNGWTFVGIESFIAPSFTGHPQDRSSKEGGEVVFEAAAEGSPAPSPRWQFSQNEGANWEDIANATDTRLVLSDLEAEQNKTWYRCVASNGIQPEALSDYAVLSVDGERPTATITPAGTGVAPSTARLAIEFSEPIDSSRGGKVVLSPNAIEGNPDFTDASKWNPERTILTVALGELRSDATYTVQVSGFVDLAGNAMVPIEGHTFVTGTIESPPFGTNDHDHNDKQSEAARSLAKTADGLEAGALAPLISASFIALILSDALLRRSCRKTGSSD